MLDLAIVAVLALIFLFALSRRDSGRARDIWATVISGALLAGFAMWWYVLGPVVLD